MLIQTPQDLFFLIYSVIGIIAGVLLLLITIYFIVFVKKLSDFSRNVKEELAKVSLMAHDLKEKLASPATYLTALVTAIIKGAKFVENIRGKKKSKD